MRRLVGSTFILFSCFVTSAPADDVLLKGADGSDVVVPEVCLN